MMEILLIRHGRPRSADNNKYSPSGYINWIRRYNLADLDPGSKPEKILVLDKHYHISSDLLRARLTAAQYSHKKIHEISGLFREMDIPYYRLPFTLRAFSWVYLCRGIWLLGKAGKFESYQAAKERADFAVNLLEVRARDHGKVVVFGHGMMNREIRQRLQQRGWSLTAKDNGYWGINRLHLG